MHLVLTMLLLCLATLSASCRRTPAAAQTHEVELWMNGADAGDERASYRFEGQRVTIETRTTLEGQPPRSLDGTLVIERGRATSLRVAGTAPASLAAIVNVTTTPDRTDTFPIQSPLPVHVLAALVRQSITSGRREFQSLPEGTLRIGACAGSEGPFPDATCHVVTGLRTGRALVWLSPRGQLVAAVASTPAGRLVATGPGREESRSALLRRFDVYSAP